MICHSEFISEFFVFGPTYDLSLRIYFRLFCFWKQPMICHSEFISESLGYENSYELGIIENWQLPISSLGGYVLREMLK
jgi:hypothetical protein